VRESELLVVTTFWCQLRSHSPRSAISLFSVQPHWPFILMSGTRVA